MIALYLCWCAATGQDWRAAAGRMPSFVLWLRHAISPPGAVAGAVGSAAVRGPRRINCVLAAVREFLAFAVDHGHAPTTVLGHLYEPADSRDLPAEALGEDGAWRLRMKARDRVPVARQRPDRASDEDVVGLLRVCRSARDRLLVLLLARVDQLVVQAHDHYVTERARTLAAQESEFVFVNLFRAPLGAPVSPQAVNELLAAASRRAGLDRPVHPHALRHAFASNVLDAGGTVDEVEELLGHQSIGACCNFPRAFGASA